MKKFWHSMFGKLIIGLVLGGSVLTATLLPDKGKEDKLKKPAAAAPFSGKGLFGTDLPDTSRYFLFPIKPGKPNYLSGTMGETRPNHFHGGIDIKTDGVIGLPVYAAQEGYISRIKISSFGYGNLLYVTHPNGLVTTYAHLDRLEEPLAGYVLQQQYKNQVFEVDLKPKKGQFPVSKGQVIAFGGNTGGSGGPHLHFEVRDTLNNLLNPLFFNFTEIRDQVAPEATAIGIRPLGINSRVNQRFDWEPYKVTKLNGNMTVTDTIKASGDIGLSLEAFDKLTGAENKNGIVELFMAVNGELEYSFSLKKIPFEKSRHILRHTDFLVWKRTGRFFQNCYLEDGNELGIYASNKSKGKLRVQPDSLYRVEFTMRDASLNTSTVTCFIKGERPRYTRTKADKPVKVGLSYEVVDNILKITAQDTARTPLNAEIFVGNMKYDLLPSYTVQSKTVYLYDLRGGLPSKITFCGKSLDLGFQQLIPSQTDFSFYHPEAELFFPQGALFDTVYLSYNRVKGRPMFNDLMVPVFKHYKLTLKDVGKSYKYNRAKAAAYALGNGYMCSYEGGQWEGDHLSFQTRNFGQFNVLSDTIAPTVKLISKSADKLRLSVKDNLSGISNWRAEVDGKWLLLKYEHKDALLYSEKLDKTVPLKGKVVIKVTDFAGNETIYNTQI